MSVSRLFGERMGKRGGHHLPILRNESNRAGRGARWRHVVWWELRKPECVGMYGDSAIAAAGRQQLAGPVGGSITTLSTVVARTRFPCA